MKKQKQTCSTCEHFVPDEFEEGKGSCMMLSDFEPEAETTTSGAEGQFWCSADWGCMSHSDNQPDIDLETVVPEPEVESAQQSQPKAGRRRPSDYL